MKNIDFDFFILVTVAMCLLAVGYVMNFVHQRVPALPEPELTSQPCEKSGGTMADFNQHIEPLITKEGGYKLTDSKGDRGGRTYAGISEKWNPRWKGWKIIADQGLESPRLRAAVHASYRENYWTPIKGDEISSGAVADALFSAAVLSGPGTAVRLVQKACGADADGVMGPQTLRMLNNIAEREFMACFGLAQIARFSAIVQDDQSQSKWFRGWVNRVLEETS